MRSEQAKTTRKRASRWWPPARIAALKDGIDSGLTRKQLTIALDCHGKSIDAAVDRYRLPKPADGRLVSHPPRYRKWCPVVIEALRVLSEEAMLPRVEIARRLQMTYYAVDSLLRYYKIAHPFDGRVIKESPKWTPAALKAVWDMIAEGWTVPEIAERTQNTPESINAAIWYHTEARRAEINYQERIKRIVARRRALGVYPKRAALRSRAPIEPYRKPEAFQVGGDLLAAINAIVPRGLNPSLRADLCQDLALAALEGEIDPRAITQERLSEFLRAAYQLSPFAAGRVSLDAPAYDAEGSRTTKLDLLRAPEPEEYPADTDDAA